MNWVRAVEALRRERRAGVLVTVTAVRGHAPREAGAKMVVASDDVWDTIGGGNLEATAVERARTLIAGGETVPQTLTMSLSDKAPSEHGQQCCGGEVTLLLEPLAVVPAVAIFGVGHVGLELARILARHDLELHLVDSRAEHVEPRRLTVLGDAVARIHVHHSPVPEVVLGQVPSGTHVLVMTHDHAEDLAIVDQALRTDGVASIGLIGSRSKWARFRARLNDAGHDDAALARVTTPIGLAEIPGKQPATIAVSVSARLLQLIEEAAPVATP